MSIQAVAVIALQLAVVVGLVVAWIKNEFATTGKVTKIISYSVSIATGIIYGIIQKYVVVNIVLLSVFIAVASNGGYNLIQNLLKTK